ncbi:hypothetical protein NQ318_017291, partial [Aromia moschata]
SISDYFFGVICYILAKWTQKEVTLLPTVLKLFVVITPPKFFLDKNLAKQYFRQFGRLKRVTFKPKLRVCTVEYTSADSFLNALNNAGEYNGTFFKVKAEKSPEVKNKKVKNPLWIDNDEVNSELEAMSGFAPKTYTLPENFTDDQVEVQAKVEKVPKLKRARNVEPVKQKKSMISKEKLLAVSPEQVEYINLIKSQATTIEERYKILDARDKLIRIKLKTTNRVKSSPTVGTCPDMCPEKERLMRETQHQVSLYEQADNGKSMNQTKAVKQYSRSSADQEAPLPHELRPVLVLQMTMGYLMHNIIDLCDSSEVNLAEWFHFLWDRTRGIRKDITQQELCCQGAVQLVEQCARFHIHCSARLVAEDPSVFDQKINTENLTKCLQSLKYMYHDLQLKGESCPNEAEFRAYIILLNLNDGNFMWEVQELRQEIQKSEEVKFALEVYSALDKNNYVKFFKLVYSTTYLNACILMRYFVQVRISAIKTLLKCYTPRARSDIYPLSELTKILGFDDAESTIDFMQAYGISINEEKTHIILEKNTFLLPEFPYLLERSLNIVESKRNCSVGKVVCGKELPSKTFEGHVPQNSFDHSGYLILQQDILDEVELKLPEDLEDNVDVVDADNTPQNIFVTPISMSSASIFGKKMESDCNFMQKPSFGSIFTQPKKEEESVSSDSNFLSQRGGFTFNLPKTAAEKAAPSIFGAGAAQMVTSPFSGPPVGSGKIPAASIKMPISPEQPLVKQTTPDLKALELQRKKEEEEKERLRREMEERQRKREREKRLLEERKREEERLREVKRKKQEEELKRRIEELRREEEKKILEIENTVKGVVDLMVAKVVDQIHEERLGEIRNNIKRRITLNIAKKWKQVALKKKRKRKAMDWSPIWISSRTVEESAEDLYTASQDLTIKLRKRYRYGRPLEIELPEEEKVTKINMFQLTYPTLNQRGIMQKTIFWKVEISLPDHYELRDGLIRMEDTLKDAFQWEDRNGTTMAIQHSKPTPVQTVTYCVERQRGLYVRYADANGIIFISKDFNSLLQRRIFENLKNFGVFTRVPIVIILQEYDREKCKLNKLIDEKIVSDYIILVDSLTPTSLVNLVEEGLVFLASKAENPPPLELDTLSSFLTRYLCTEVWKRANSFAKWNSHYKTCLKNPNILISLYNKALAKLKKIVLNKSCFEYPTFPDVFEEYLQSEIPPCLPCNYYYFPKFWKSDAYITKIEDILDGLVLPKWQEKWPPGNEFDLELNLTRYCVNAFQSPEKPFYKAMSVLLRDIDPNANFEDIKKVLWTEVIEVLSLEKLRQSNLSLTGTAFETKSVFNQYVVVYNTDTLEDYKKSDWFYINNPLIKMNISQQLENEKKMSNKKEKVRFDANLNVDLDKVIAEATNLVAEKKNVDKLKRELAEFDSLLGDLESSMKIHKKDFFSAGGKFEEGNRG